MKAPGSHRSHRDDTTSLDSIDGPRSRDLFTVGYSAGVEASREARAPHAARGRKLIAGERYFGLDAAALQAGAARVLDRVGANPERRGPLRMADLGTDFRMNAAASVKLVRALLAGGLLRPDGAGAYRVTSVFDEYARGYVVAPLAHARARSLIRRAQQMAARINAEWARNPYAIQMIAVSGPFLARREALKELPLWLVPRERSRGRRTAPRDDDALRQIGVAINALSSFIVLHVVPATDAIDAPFAVVFESAGEPADASAPWDRLRDWSASIGRRFGAK